MPKVTYIEHTGTPHEIEVAEGLSVMEGAIRNNVPGIEAECGGSCMCATCHVYVDEAWLDKLPPREETEKEMLEFTSEERRDNSRLGCQIKLTAALDGLTVRLPATQS